MAEDLTEYYENVGVRVRYLHSDIKTLERVELIRDLRKGEYNVLIGINLLREGLDIPEVSLVAILDADKEGFLRSERSLVQTCGRAARNADGKVILYADNITRSMQYTMDETNRRRIIQDQFNREHGIIPETIKSEVKDSMAQHLKASGWEGTVYGEAMVIMECCRRRRRRWYTDSWMSCGSKSDSWRKRCRRLQKNWPLKRLQPIVIG